MIPDTGEPFTSITQDVMPSGQTRITTDSPGAIASFYFPCEDEESDRLREQLKLDIEGIIERNLLAARSTATGATP